MLATAKERSNQSLGLILVVAMGFISLGSDASEPSYNETFSYRYTDLTGIELSEDGLRRALDEFDELGLIERIATISVVGEQNYQALIPSLMSIYNRSPEQAPDARKAYLYSDGGSMDYARVYVARALVRCGDPEGARLALKLAMKGHNMSLVPSQYAIRTIKYIVLHFGTDMSKVLEFLVGSGDGQYGQEVARTAARELVEIQKFLQLKSEAGRPNTKVFFDVQKSLYSAAIERCVEAADSRVKLEFERRGAEQPTWLESFKLINPKERERAVP